MSEKKTLSRSEAVRQRRQSRTKAQARPQKRKSRTKSTGSYRELPPITARGVVNDFAIERRKKAGSRRFNATAGALRPRTVSLPRVQIRVGWRLLSFFLVLLFGTGLYLFWTLPEFRVNSAQVTGNQRITADEINSALELNGRPIFLLTPDNIKEQTLQAYPGDTVCLRKTNGSTLLVPAAMEDSVSGIVMTTSATLRIVREIGVHTRSKSECPIISDCLICTVGYGNGPVQNIHLKK